MAVAQPAIIQATQPGSGGRRLPKPRGTLFGLHPGQIVITQAAAAGVVASVAVNPAWAALTGPLCLLLLLMLFGRFKGRWVYQWLAQSSHYLGKRSGLAADSTPTDLLALLRPEAVLNVLEVDSAQVGVIEDLTGLTAILELGNTTGLLSEPGNSIPSIASLLPTAITDQPVIRLQLLFTAVAAPTASGGATTAATSYRQLTEGRILAQQRALIAVHARRYGGFSDQALRRSLASAVRRVQRRLGRVQLPCRALAGDSVLQAIADFAHHESCHPLRESWGEVEAGGLHQTCFQLTRWPEPDSDLGRSFLTRLLAIPGGCTTVSLAVERSDPQLRQLRTELVVRLAAGTQVDLRTTTTSLRSLLDTAGAQARPLDGSQLAALAATIPLGGAAGGRSAVLSGMVAGKDGLGLDGIGLPMPVAHVADLSLPVGGAGMVIGINRHQQPVTIRLFRPEPTRVVMVGGLRFAQMVTLRAIAVGAQVVVQSGRPAAWEPFLRGVSARGTAVITLVTPGQLGDPPAATATRPQLLVVDVGPVGATGVPIVEAGWRTALLVRDDLGPADLDVVARADLVLLQPLTPNEADIASAALGLGQAASWLTKIRADMAGIVVGRRVLRWALVTATPLEKQLIGSLTRPQGPQR